MERLLLRTNVIVNITGDRKALTAATSGPGGEAMKALLDALPEGSGSFRLLRREAPQDCNATSRWAQDALEKGHFSGAKQVAVVVPAAVSDMCLSVPIGPIGTKWSGADLVGAAYLEKPFLWDKVREQQGAYGAWARVSAAGVFSLFSHRDPEILLTLGALRSTPAVAQTWAEQADDIEILEAIFPAISLLDHPEKLSAKGLTSFWRWIKGETHDHMNEFRRQIITMTKGDIKKFADKLKDALRPNMQSITLIGSEAVAMAVRESGEPLEIIHAN
ncbi:mitochondrial presequence protease related protein [Cyclospora cayetanensis]|uniref:Mitochondrial presequence protease related protein n=1 Tax=Cyclospora cayetanensis TaxID=88456 RepID=A0A1D3CX77_9EIME|nr:mitochondrial presequence protease related protein [Cyclospora cayetanensis]